MSETTQMQTEAQPTLKSVAEIKYLTSENAVFARTAGGFISLEFGGEKHERVGIFRSFPLDYPEEYLTVKNPENKEIGIIERLRDFDEATIEICRAELFRRYFIPVIFKINSFKEKYGSAHVDLNTDIGDVQIVIADMNHNIVGLEGGQVFITDASGNRYLVPDIEKLDKRSQRYLEVYL